MKPLNYLILFLSITSVSACANINDKREHSNQLIYGTWNCKMASEDAEFITSLDIETNYVRNGKSNSFGIFKFNVPQGPEIEFSYADSANWEIKEGYLISTTTEIKIVNLSHPEFDELFNLERMFPQNISESFQILKLSETELSLKDESDGNTQNCSKV